MAGSTAEIGIRVFLEDAAEAGLAAINDNLQRMSSLANAASKGIQSLSDALAGLNGSAVAQVASDLEKNIAPALDADIAAVDGLKSSIAGLDATESEAAAAQREFLSTLQAQAQVMQEAANAARAVAEGDDVATKAEQTLSDTTSALGAKMAEVGTVFGETGRTLAGAFIDGLITEEEYDAALARLLGTAVAVDEETTQVAGAVREQAQAMQEDAAATKEDADATLTLTQARAQLLGTMQAMLDSESRGIAMMRDIAAEEKAAAVAVTDLGTATQTAADKMLGLNRDGLTQFNAGVKTAEQDVRGLVPVLDEAGNATGAYAYQSGTASEKVGQLRQQGQGLLATLDKTKPSADGATMSLGNMVTKVADAINEYMALGFMVQMVVSALGQFISLGAGIQDTFNVIQGMSGSTDAQMQQWSNSIVGLDRQYGILETDSVSALDLITRAGFQGAAATTVLSDAMLLADSTGQSMADSTKAMTLAMDIFNLSAAQGRQVSLDFFNALSQSTLPLSDYISLLDQSGLTAKALGINVDDLISTMGKMGQVMGGSSISVRELQSVLDGLLTFTQLSSTAMSKLAQGFDLTAFSALNSTGKFLDLAKAADGNVQAFARMIGGAGNAQSALDALGISTKTLTNNAAALGLSFDPVRYNSLDAADKLLYLAQVAGYNSTTFTNLTKGGLEPASAALLTLSNAMDAAGKKLAEMSPQFDMAAFKSADLSQKLHMLADYVGGPGTAAFATYVGGIKNVPLAIDIMNQEVDKTPGHMNNASQAVLNHGAAYQKMMNQIDNATQDYQAQLTKQDKAAQKVADDATHQTTTIQADWQNVSTKFVNDFGPAISAVLKGLDNDLTNIGKSSNTASGLFYAPWPGVEANLEKVFTKFGDFMSTFFTVTVHNDITKGQTDNSAAVGKYADGINGKFQTGTTDWGKTLTTFFETTVPQIITNGMVPANTTTTKYTQSISDTLQNKGATNWGNIIQTAMQDIAKWFQWLSNTLVGHSIVPDMVTAITNTFQTGGNTWLTTILTSIINIVSAFATLPGKVLTWITSMTSQVLGDLGTFAGSMFTSGLNAVGQFAAGIAAGAANAIAQAWNIANQVAGILAHHSPPKEGPMRDDDTWMPNMMRMFASGIEQNAPLFKNALVGAASGVASGVASVPQMVRTSGSVSLNGASAASGGTYNISLLLDGRVVTQVVLSNINGQMQMNGLGRAFR